MSNKNVLGDLQDDLELKNKSFVEKWNEYLSYFFDKIAILDQDSESKENISQTVVEGSKVGTLYWSQIILSALIATFGLLQNSVAVVIGAMLLAPLFIPLQALAFAITEGKSKLFWRSLGVLFLSTLISVGIAIGIVWIVPLEVETSEILSRVSPNIYDLFIAGFSAVIALLALVYKKLSQSVAGVAMAASLMPPLSVIGIQIGFGNFSKAGGALLLYTTNIVAILLVGVLMFILYGFHPHKDKSYSVITQGVFLLIVTVGLSVPLVASIQGQQAEIALFNKVKVELSNSLVSTLPMGEISELEVVDKNNVVEISLDLRLPEEVGLFESDMQKFTDSISSKMDREINLNLDIIRTASLNKQLDVNEVLKRNVQEFIVGSFESAGGKVLVESKVSDYNEDFLDLRLLYAIEEGEDFSEEEKNGFLFELQNEFSDEEFVVSWVLLNSVSELQSESKVIQNGLRAYLENELAAEWFIDRLAVNEFESDLGESFEVRIWLSLPEEIVNQISDSIVITSELERILNLYKFENYKATDVPEFILKYDYSSRYSE